MLVKIIKGPGVGTVLDLVPQVARARLAGGTAELWPRVETTALEPAAERAITPKQNPPPVTPGRSPGRRR